MIAANSPSIFLIAGEVSADNIGGRIMGALRRRVDGPVRFAGIGGAAMAREGLQSLYPMDEFSLVGLTEVVPHIPRILRRMGQVAAEIRRTRPDLVLCIDTSGFSRGVARRLSGSGIPIVQYKAPQAWAYWSWRAWKMARYFNCVLAILPFEPDFFAPFGVDCRFIGHPALESGARNGDGLGFRNSHGIPVDAPVLCVLPGSRASEVRWSLPDFGGALAILKERMPDLRIVVPTVSTVAATVTAAARSWPLPTVVVEDDVARFDAFAASNAALAVTGTVTVELAIAQVPMIGCYRASPLTAWVARRIVRVDYLTIVNLVLDSPAVPELLQHSCRPDALAAACTELLLDTSAQDVQRSSFAEALAQLGAGGPPPTERAADIVLELLAARGAAPFSAAAASAGAAKATDQDARAPKPRRGHSCG
jgi:lipid-A-disaccharide synthase